MYSTVIYIYMYMSFTYTVYCIGTVGWILLYTGWYILHRGQVAFDMYEQSYIFLFIPY
jgi:hypothetical protein